MIVNEFILTPSTLQIPAGMGGTLSVQRDALTQNTRVVAAYSSFLGDSSILQENWQPGQLADIIFNHGLAWGSHYNVVVVVHEGPNNEAVAYKRTLRCRRAPYALSEIVRPQNRVDHVHWECPNCHAPASAGSIRVCTNCFTNYHTRNLRWAQLVPVVSIPIGVALTVMDAGRAKVLNSIMNGAEGRGPALQAVGVAMAKYPVLGKQHRLRFICINVLFGEMGLLKQTSSGGYKPLFRCAGSSGCACRSRHGIDGGPNWCRGCAGSTSWYRSGRCSSSQH